MGDTKAGTSQGGGGTSVRENTVGNNIVGHYKTITVVSGGHYNGDITVVKLTL